VTNSTIQNYAKQCDTIITPVLTVYGLQGGGTV